jgi:hypothetical protein
MRGATVVFPMLLLSLGGAAAAASLPAAKLSDSVQILFSGTTAGELVNATVDETASPPSLTMDFSGSVPGKVNLRYKSSASLFYEFEVLGPTAKVPIEIGSTGDVTSTFGSSASVEAQIQGLGFDLQADSVNGAAVGSLPTSFDVLDTVSVKTGKVFDVRMLEKASADICSSCDPQILDTSFSASVDPYFVVPDGYTLVLSPAAGNNPPVPPPVVLPDGFTVTLPATTAFSTVPEPSTWTLMLAGLISLGFLRLRRSQPRAAGYSAALATLGLLGCVVQFAGGRE